jgi:hypothetical protein
MMFSKPADRRHMRPGCALSSDRRYMKLIEGLAQLNEEAILRLQEYTKNGRPLILDDVHFDAKSGLWCPLAVALEVPKVAKDENLAVEQYSETKIKELIVSVGRNTVAGFGLNPMSGVRGNYYTDNRYEDLKYAIARVATQVQVAG